MTMTLRRCDSLPIHLREAPVPTESDTQTQLSKIPDTLTIPNFLELPDRDQVIATWKSLHTDVKKIKNGFPTKNELANHEENKKEPITHNYIPAFSYKKSLRRKITYNNRHAGVSSQEVDRSSSFPLDTGQANIESGTRMVRRRTLLQRLLPWKTQECDCQERYIPKYKPIPNIRAEDLLCTCGASASRLKPPDNSKKYGERGRSKSVGYEAAREVTQFRRCASAGATVGAETAAALRARAALTLARRYYPEGGWGWTITVVGTIVQVLSHGLQLGGGTGAIACTAAVKYRVPPLYTHGCLGALSAGVALALSPVTVALCVRKSTRVTAVVGGLVAALGCLFTSFATQFHQLFFSYGTVVGVGVGLTRDCSTLMVAQYFKRRRELVEIFVVSGSGLGIAVMSTFIKGAIRAIGWRLGLQAVTGVVFVTFILGTFYRSASLYHPQRRAILHLKNQNKIKRKMKDRNKSDDRQPFFDFSTLKSKTVRILLMSTGISAFGINTPIFYLAYHAEQEGLGDTAELLQAYLGLAWAVGCAVFGLLVRQNSAECRIARQYLTQAAVFVCGLATMALTAVEGSYRGYVMFAWIYGIFCGGYHYSLKMYTYERVRSRNFARAWGFVQCSQAVPIAIGVPLSGYINVGCGGKAGYYFSSTCSLIGSLSLFCIDLHRRSVAHKQTKENGGSTLCETVVGGSTRRSHSREREPRTATGAATALVLGAELIAPGRTGRDLLLDSIGPGSLGSPPTNIPPELTCISEEGGLDLDLDLDIPEHLLEDLDCGGDCITSCNKVENYLMLSEYENNLIAELPNMNERRHRRWSIVMANSTQQSTIPEQHSPEHTKNSIKWKKKCHNANNRLITVINEASL
ncbi:monocarboxylate transporter 10-like isoform X1 [Achroia grisella]|uniref:monocarboxylate transporter 10-like isoform X1 n=1 Tax=Achroia grisella TaxID=688607 RepID=UPI0027D3302F|nr:monocarboxylate transporter 10-like isoform X1 [Achroia grisella]